MPARRANKIFFTSRLSKEGAKGQMTSGRDLRQFFLDMQKSIDCNFAHLYSDAMKGDSIMAKKKAKKKTTKKKKK
jgi:hypothetical protein